MMYPQVLGSKGNSKNMNWGLMFTEHQQYGRHCVRETNKTQSTSSKDTGSNAGRPPSKGIIKQMAKMFKTDPIHCGQEQRKRDLLGAEEKNAVGNWPWLSEFKMHIPFTLGMQQLSYRNTFYTKTHAHKGARQQCSQKPMFKITKCL